MNVFENKTTASINTYIPDNKYTQRKKTDKKANFSGKVYFTEYIEDLTNLLKRFKLKSQFNKTSTVVCFEQIQIVNYPCKGNQGHWYGESCPIDDPDRRAVFYTRTITKCVNGGSYTIDNPNNGDFFIEDPLGGGGLPGGGATTPVGDIDDDCEDGFTKNLEGECVQYACYDDKKEYDEITQRCECIEGYDENTEGACIKKPCAGDPIKNPEISDYNAGKSSNRFGCVRKDPNRTCNTIVGDRFHAGIDLKADVGSSVYSTSDGNVFAKGSSSTFGNYIIIKKGDLFFLYAHLKNIPSTNGLINKGDIIAVSGESATVGEPHLHMEVRKRNGTEDYNNMEKLNIENYITTKFNQDGSSITNNCN